MTKDTITLAADNIVLSGGKAVDLKTKDATIKASGALNLSRSKSHSRRRVEEEVTIDGKPSTTMVRVLKISVNAKSYTYSRRKSKDRPYRCCG